MKVSIKTGAVKFNVTHEAGSEVIEKLTAVNGVELENPIPAKSRTSPGKSCDFSMEPCEYTFECEPGELAEIYKEVMPVIKDIAKMFAMAKE